MDRHQPPLTRRHVVYYYSALYRTTIDGQPDYNSLLRQNVTHLDISCGNPDNWDADADDDGITYYVTPRSADDTIIPIEGTITATIYENVPDEDSYWPGYKRSTEPLTTVHDTLTGSARLDKFTEWGGYELRLQWDDIPPYNQEGKDWGEIEVTFERTDGTTYAARTERASYSSGSCQLRELPT